MTKSNLIGFMPIKIEDKLLYESFFDDNEIRGCEYSFANLFLWGRQSIAKLHNHIVLFSQFSRRTVYPYPVGSGDKKAVLEAIIADSRERGIPCRITGLSENAKNIIQSLFPDKFRFHCDEASFDYVYDINDLADLKGKKYHSKRNHIHRFCEEYPNWRVEPITDNNISVISKMVDEWYEDRLNDNPNNDFHMERIAISKALRHFEGLRMEGLVLFDGDRALAFTMGSKLNDDVIDVNFEKAVYGVNGAYAIINREFAKYIRDKNPHIKYLNREEDMGLEGLRKAKQSYKPHHMVFKCWACLLEEGYEY